MSSFFKRKHIKTFIVILIMSLLCFMAMPQTVEASYNSWTEGNSDYNNIYGESAPEFGVETSTPEEEKVGKEPSWFEKMLSNSVIDNAYLLWAMLDEANISIDIVIFGRLNSSVTTNLFGFDLSDGNVYGVIGSIIYALFRNFIYGAMGIYYMWLLISYVLNRTVGKKVNLVEALQHFLFVFLMLYALPIVIDAFIMVRDGFMLYALRFVNGILGHSTLDLSSLFLSQAESTGKFMYAVLSMFTVAGCLVLALNYIKISVQETYYFLISPVVLMRSFSDKQILSKWAGQFFTNLAVPLLDMIGFFLILLVMKLYPTGTIGVQIVALFMFFTIIPSRNGILALFGAPVPGGRGFAMAPMMFMAMRAMMMGGKGGNRGVGAAGIEGSPSNHLDSSLGNNTTNTIRPDGYSSSNAANIGISDGGMNTNYSSTGGGDNITISMSGNRFESGENIGDITYSGQTFSGDESIFDGNTPIDAPEAATYDMNDAPYMEDMAEPIHSTPVHGDVADDGAMYGINTADTPSTEPIAMESTEGPASTAGQAIVPDGVESGVQNGVPDVSGTSQAQGASGIPAEIAQNIGTASAADLNTATASEAPITQGMPSADNSGIPMEASADKIAKQSDIISQAKADSAAIRSQDNGMTNAENSLDYAAQTNSMRSELSAQHVRVSQSSKHLQTAAKVAAGAGLASAGLAVTALSGDPSLMFTASLGGAMAGNAAVSGIAGKNAAAGNTGGKEKVSQASSPRRGTGSYKSHSSQGRYNNNRGSKQPSHTKQTYKPSTNPNQINKDRQSAKKKFD